MVEAQPLSNPGCPPHLLWVLPRPGLGMEPKAAVSLEGPDQKSPPTGVETPKVVLSLVARPHFLCAETSLPVCREGDGVTAKGLASRIGQVQNAGVLDCTPCDFCGISILGRKMPMESYLDVRIGVPWAATRGLSAPLVKTVLLSGILPSSNLPISSPKPGPCFLPAIPRASE